MKTKLTKRFIIDLLFTITIVSIVLITLIVALWLMANYPVTLWGPYL
jgi:hypothetical protein